MNKLLILYDDNGLIWSTSQVDEAPIGLEKYVFDVPSECDVVSIDLSDPTHPTPVYSEAKGVDVVQMSNDITDLQIALAEVYELVAGGME